MRPAPAFDKAKSETVQGASRMDEVATELAVERHFGLDWLRIAAFLLLILNHIGMYFAPAEWLVKAPVEVRGVIWPLLAMQPWRLPLLFAVSGFASFHLLAKSDGALPFLRARSARLLLPLAFGLVVLVPPQTWVSMVGTHGYRHGLGHFWLVDWPEFGTVNGVSLPRTEHLWFIAYLWTYTAALCLLLAAPPAWRVRAGALTAHFLARPSLLILPMAGLLLLRVVVLFTVPEIKGVLHDWSSDLIYLPIFLFGFALAANPGHWPLVLRLRRPAIAAAAAALLVLVAVELAFPAARTHLAQAADRAASLLMAWSMVVVLLGLAHQWLRRDHPWRRTLSEAVFPLYLVHQTIIVLVGWRLRDSGLDALPAFLILVAATLAGGWAFYAVGRRIAWLRPWIGLSAVPPRAPRRLQPA